MLNKMNILLAATAAVALSAGAAVAQDRRDNGPDMSVTVGDQGQAGYYGNGYNYGYDDAMARRERNARYRAEAWHAQPAGLIAVDVGGVAFGYRDGYWDKGHTWHRWNSKREMRAYRDRDGSHYYSRDHHHYDNDGWQH